MKLGACHAQHCVVFARLIVEGVDEGIHGVLVRIRGDDLGPISGVTVEDMGHKMGLNGGKYKLNVVQLIYIKFKHYLSMCFFLKKRIIGFH